MLGSTAMQVQVKTPSWSGEWQPTLDCCTRQSAIGADGRIVRLHFDLSATRDKSREGFRIVEQKTVLDHTPIVLGQQG